MIPRSCACCCLAHSDHQLNPRGVTERLRFDVLGNRPPGHELHHEVRWNAPVPSREREHLRHPRVLQAAE
jgi:hypothetical protein